MIKFTSKKLIGLPLADDPLKVSKKLDHFNSMGENSVLNGNGLAYKKEWVNLCQINIMGLALEWVDADVSFKNYSELITVILTHKQNDIIQIYVLIKLLVCINP